MSVRTATTVNPPTALDDKKRKTAALLVILFGSLLVLGTTYANPLTLHNAAHDSRHAFGFPCH
ncbi:MAG: CbtB-domain containing protein [Proteobacteria bacterium]|nr:CbtB-domain containing protein [Pseudomonadota bacterium]